MPQLNPQPGVIPLPQAINKYFELSLYLLVLMGFATLASTGALDLPTILLVGMALALRGYLLAERRRVVISERWTAPLTIAYFVFYAVDYFCCLAHFWRRRCTWCCSPWWCAHFPCGEIATIRRWRSWHF